MLVTSLRNIILVVHLYQKKKKNPLKSYRLVQVGRLKMVFWTNYFQPHLY